MLYNIAKVNGWLNCDFISHDSFFIEQKMATTKNNRIHVPFLPMPLENVFILISQIKHMLWLLKLL